MEYKRTNPILYVIIILLAVNLLGTFWLINKVHEQPRKLVSKSTDQESLPDYLTKEVRKEIYKKFEEAFNSRDHDKFFNLFSDFARAQMDQSQANASYDHLLSIFGEVSNGLFSYYEFVERQGNLRKFNLYYFINLPDKPLKGKLRITITDDGKEYGIIGVNMNTE
jgi:hypothetical protein